ncbi:hypothetical protein UFOVP1604_217 [uncultured Caudovirales phage]|uniref:Uncharacterized protein n=1 Tax=uncultured Caudovirales phage TaxID=2100421 RepID=A0A6J5SWJ4_9CAUD|nr:hypothetical protein UFOVP1604_217 [uncultured Caudovirales phage]
MAKSFIEAINESNINQGGLVDEMGVKRPERLAGSHIGRARQETVTRRQQLANQPVRRSYSEVAADLTRALKQVPRLDITMEKPSNTRDYYPRFPQPIVELFKELKQIDEGRMKNDFGKWRDIYPTSDSAVQLKTEGPSSFQRSHFPNDGITPSLRGTGLGYKLYRTLLKYAGYISSNSSGTREKDKAWGSLLDYKANPDGTPSVDDALAIIGSGNWMAMDKGISTQSKIDVAERFITEQIGFNNTKPDRFDIDDELLSILPDTFLTKLDDEYLTSLGRDGRISNERLASINASRTEAQRLDRERRERQEAETRERRTREEAETRQRLASRIAQYGAEPDAEWNVGDFIVVKSYLYDASYDSLPIRQVVDIRNGTYIAVGINDAIRIENGELTPGNSNDTRTTNDKSIWVKVNIESIPDLDRVNLTSAGKTFISNRLRPEVIQQRREAEAQAERERIERDRSQNVARTADKALFGRLDFTGAELKQAVNNRQTLDNLDLLKKIRTGNFAKFVVLAEPQQATLRGAAGVPVFVAVEKIGRATRSVESPQELISNPRNIMLVNVVTGKTVEGPFVGMGLVALSLEPVTEQDKLMARAGDHYYIANHQNNWGILSKCDYTTRNTANQPFIYLRTFGGAERPTPVRLDLLRKITDRTAIV